MFVNIEKNPNIITVENLDKLPEKIKSEIINPSQSKLIINFPTDSIKHVNMFIKNNKSTNNDIYLQKNYQIQINMERTYIDLLVYLIDCISLAHSIILSNIIHDKTLFGDINLWNISVCSNIMFNYPFTLDQIIYIPIKYIKDCASKPGYETGSSSDSGSGSSSDSGLGSGSGSGSGSDSGSDSGSGSGSKDLIKTLIHEKLHIGQRTNQTMWENYIKTHDKNWIKIIPTDPAYRLIEKSLLEKTSNYEFISNPDTMYENFKYIYKFKNNIYYGNFVYLINTQSIEKKYFLIDFEKNKLVITDIVLEQEHPYEQFAYKIANDLIN